MEYSQKEYLMLSGIQHFAFCRRQWALIHVENQWQENYHTAIGNVFHEKAHDNTFVEKRGDIITSRAIPIHSTELKISGECDIVEFRKNLNGVEINGYEGLYIPYPIEYKKGSPKKTDIDILQLVAQVICLEEMFLCDIDRGYIYYGKTRHREEVVISDELKNKVRMMVKEMHMIFKEGYTPKVRLTKACNACSLREVCLPELSETRSVKSYIEKNIKEDQ
ncbi:MAG TPA: CRISPR-associated protein Cas4 [Epulopiscium sp.]|nr:CRISPR-associated protein Cas4 [Candidatus Epulonipiscium sp.]